MSPLRLEHVLRKDLKDGQSKTGLARQTDGWKFAHQYRAGVKNKVVRIPRQSENFTSVSEEHGLGRAEQIFAVNANYQNDLMRCAQEKMAERAQPSQKGWDEKKKILQSCWLIEEVNGDYFCDCYEGIRGRMCEHTVGMHFRQNTGRITATEQVRSLPIAAKRKAGRPKKLPASCLTKSPVKVTRPAEPALDVTTEELVPVVTVVVHGAAGGAMVRSMACTPCQEDGLVARAVAYCPECADHLCQECDAAHSRNRLTKRHVCVEPSELEDLLLAAPASPPVRAPSPAASPARASSPPASAPSPVRRRRQLAVQTSPLARAPSPAAAVQATGLAPGRLICQHCGMEVGKKSIQAHWRSEKCQRQRATQHCSTEVPVSQAKRPRLQPTSLLASCPPRTRARQC